jgi:hypothetical protein
MVWDRGDSSVEGIEEGGIEGTKRELRNDV